MSIGCITDMVLGAQNTSVNVGSHCPFGDYILGRVYQFEGIKRKLLCQCFREGGYKSQICSFIKGVKKSLADTQL